MNKPSFLELARQGLSSTQRGYDLLAGKFEATDYATPEELIEQCLKWGEHHFPLPNWEQPVAADLACGTGRATRLLAAGGCLVDGYDFSSGMLEQAAFLSKDLEGIRWHQADLARLELTEQAYHRIVTFGAWGHILPEFRDRLLAGILSALKPGGLFLTATANEARWWERRFWQSLIFDLGVRLRNAVWRHQFHMYYRLNNTSDLLQRLCRMGEGGYLVSVGPVEEEPRLSMIMVRRAQTD